MQTYDEFNKDTIDIDFELEQMCSKNMLRNDGIVVIIKIVRNGMIVKYIIDVK